MNVDVMELARLADESRVQILWALDDDALFEVADAARLTECDSDRAQESVDRVWRMAATMWAIRIERPMDTRWWRLVGRGVAEEWGLT